MIKQLTPSIATLLAIILLGGGLFIGARNITRATQTGPPPCEQRIKSECVPRGPKPICPNPNPKRIGAECVPRGPKPICPLPNPTPCPYAK